jgi:hypothetical protein
VNQPVFELASGLSLFIYIILAAWRKVRDDSNPKVDWLIAGYVEGSTKDITVLKSGNGGIDQCSQELPVNQAVFGGFRHQGRFMTFFYADEGTPTMQKGRASMHKNGELLYAPVSLSYC